MTEQTSGPHVLIVEDSALMSDALRMLFEHDGFRVSVAGSVREAVHLGGESSVDVMLLDLTLADGDGLHVLDGLRKRTRLPRATLAVTGRDDDATRERCLAAGCDEVLLKPVPWNELVATTRRWAESAASPDA